AVAQNTIASQVPGPHERARFMSLQSATQHFASSTGAIVSSFILVEGEGMALEGFGTVVFISIALFSTLPVFMWVLERKVRANRDAVESGHGGLVEAPSGKPG
ncbi:MAG: MFS transporter, partial [Myxococcota bacterium]